MSCLIDVLIDGSLPVSRKLFTYIYDNATLSTTSKIGDDDWFGGRRGRDRIIIGFTAYLCNQCPAPLKL